MLQEFLESQAKPKDIFIERTSVGKKSRYVYKYIYLNVIFGERFKKNKCFNPCSSKHIAVVKVSWVTYK